MEYIGTSIKGIYRDVLLGADGQPIRDSGWVSNTIVTRCRVLLAGFMKGEPEQNPQGIQYLAVGEGDEKWDSQGASAPTPDTTELVKQAAGDPIFVTDLKMVYLNDKDVPVTDHPTNRLQITAELKPGYPAPINNLNTYPLREFGLFGKINGENYMINCVRHPVIHKDSASTLVRVIRLHF